MTIVSSATVLKILSEYEREDCVQASPRTGHIRIADVNNDVTCAIEKMGGIEKASELLDATLEQLDGWIDEHYVPEPYASQIHRHTGYSIWSLQEPTFYVFSGGSYWPHKPSEHELTRPQGIGLYMRKIPRYSKPFPARRIGR